MKRFIILLAVALIATTNICSAQGGFNEIRFRGWGEKEWNDNDYIRELRSYIDACARGEINDEALEAHKGLLDSKFCVASIEPALFGGAFILCIFLDDTSKMFGAQVYGEVDEQREVVVGYEVRSIDLFSDECTLSKEDILQFIKEHPLHKLW